MRIVIDMQACQSTGSRHRGIGRYSLALARAMARQAGTHELHLMLSTLFADSIAPVQEAFAGLLPPERMHVWRAAAPVAELNPGNRWRVRAGEMVREQAVAELKPDVVHVSSLFEGLTDDALTSIAQNGLALPTAVTLYDLIPLINAGHYLENPQVRAWYYRKVQALKRADLLLAISASSRQEGLDLLDLPPERIVNISSAVDERFCPRDYAPAELLALRQRYGLTRPFVMYTGGIDLRKNIEALIRAFAALPAAMRVGYQLAIVCSVQSADRMRLQKLASQAGLQDGELVLTGFVPDEDLPLLYHACELFVFPSWHEGFGLPALEAMACGAAVIASDTSSLPEVIGRADALFDPRNEAAISRKMHEALSDAGFRQSLCEHGLQQARKFSWDASAKTALAAFEQLHELRQTVRQSVPAALTTARKPRLAFFSPLPPERSGIADYSAGLLPELVLYYEIDLIVDQEQVSDDWLNANFPVRSWQWFDQHASRYERIVYSFGNSTFHTYMLDMLARHPGVVILHDFYLSGLLAHLELTAARPGIWAQALYASHGYHAVLERVNSEQTAPVIWKYPCNGAVLEQAHGIIVHSGHAAQLACQWYGDQASAWVRQIPLLRKLPGQTDRKAARARLGLNDGDFLVCSFGILGQPKLNHLLLEAWLASPLAREANCHLVFVGQNDGGPYGKQLLATIKAGAAERVRITGYADPATFHAYLQAADATVQLRGLSRGETSAAVLDCMACGLPTIINSNGAMAELPGDVVIKLDDDFSPAQLSAQLVRLYQDAALRESLGRTARTYTATQHAPERVGRSYVAAIEEFYERHPACRMRHTLRSIAALEGDAAEAELVELARCLAQNQRSSGTVRVLIDIEAARACLAPEPLAAVITAFIAATPARHRVELVRCDGANVRLARGAAHALLGIGLGVPDDETLELRQRDILLQLQGGSGGETAASAWPGVRQCSVPVRGDGTAPEALARHWWEILGKENA